MFQSQYISAFKIMKNIVADANKYFKLINNFILIKKQCEIFRKKLENNNESEIS